MYSGGCSVCKSFLDIKRVSVFRGLNVTIQVLAHLAILSRSELRIYAAETGFSTTIAKPVSSAKSLMLELISFTISLMYRRKRRGARIDPCGTPACIKFHPEQEPGRITLCLLLVR